MTGNAQIRALVDGLRLGDSIKILIDLGEKETASSYSVEWSNTMMHKLM